MTKMTNDKMKLIVGALCHDIGKLLYRSGDGNSYSQFVTEFLAEIGIEDRDINDMVYCHCASELKSSGLDKMSPAYIVYTADNIAASRLEEDSKVKKGFDPSIPLKSIFNSLNGNCQDMHYRPSVLDDGTGCNMPTNEAFECDASFYDKIRSAVKDAVKGINPVSREYVDSLLGVLENYCSFIPSSAAASGRADISFYDHVKMTAAYASCIYQYLSEKGISDYNEELFLKSKEFYEEKAFSLISVDLSGIQKFIYTIHSEGALRMLRSRSFYLEILMEHIIDMLLDSLELSRANLIYSGGGRCYILAANTKKITKKTDGALEECMTKVNAFFREQFDIALFAAAAFVPCSANDLHNKQKDSCRELFRKLSDYLSANKKARYSADDIRSLNQNTPKDSSRECRVCKKLSDVPNDKGLCQFCADLDVFSRRILNENENFFAVFSCNAPGSLSLPGNAFLRALSREEDLSAREDPRYIRSYSKNKFYTGKQAATRLWVGDYNYRRPGTTEVMTTEDYAKEVRGIDEKHGIGRIAVLRADVDNLGKAFVSGFAPDTSLSRTATFSRMLSLFFKHYINFILGNPEHEMCDKPAGPRKATIVYSGGDDVFLVGSWNDVVELAVDLSEKLKEFSQGTLTMSAGIGIYSPSYPLSVCAEETAELEERSKSYPDAKKPEKNAITVFSREHSFSWVCWKEQVIGKKLQRLFEFLDESFDEFSERGMAFLYRMLELIRRIEEDDRERINLARFAYLLARLEPKDESDKPRQEEYRNFAWEMYNWVQKKEERRQLMTAICLYVYLHREKEES